ncbi:hypothetical protein JCM17478_28830 [Thermopirellula anaerolimosa]
MPDVSPGTVERGTRLGGTQRRRRGMIHKPDLNRGGGPVRSRADALVRRPEVCYAGAAYNVQTSVTIERPAARIRLTVANRLCVRPDTCGMQLMPENFLQPGSTMEANDMTKQLTWRKAIEKVLSEASGAMHYRDITQRIIEATSARHTSDK